MDVQHFACNFLQVQLVSQKASLSEVCYVSQLIFALIPGIIFWMSMYNIAFYTGFKVEGFVLFGWVFLALRSLVHVTMMGWVLVLFVVLNLWKACLVYHSPIRKRSGRAMLCYRCHFDF